MRIDSLQRVTSRRADKLHRQSITEAEQGHMLMALRCSNSHAAAPTEALNLLVDVCYSLRQYHRYSDSSGQPKGFLSWAWLSEFTLDRLQANPFVPLHPSEWNEGVILCFCDVVATAQTAHEIAQDLGGGLFPDEACYITMQTGTDGSNTLIRFESNERAELTEWLIGLYA
jgi:hemolysin-activating ACP:hemolysin acyltransferase